MESFIKAVDFFKGNSKMMLEDLPYYVVNGIKV